MGVAVFAGSHSTIPCLFKELKLKTKNVGERNESFTLYLKDNLTIVLCIMTKSN